MADKLFKDKALTIPCVIDGMDNLVNEASRAHPDRIFLVRTDGRLAVAGARGPWGFEPALQETRRWMTQLREAGTEPELAKNAAEQGEDRHVTPLPEDGSDGKPGSAADQREGDGLGKPDGDKSKDSGSGI